MRLCVSDSWFFITKSESSGEYGAEMRPASRMFGGSHPGSAEPDHLWQFGQQGTENRPCCKSCGRTTDLTPPAFFGSDPLRSLLVLRQGDINGFRVTRMSQDKAQSEGNGMSFSRAATRYWLIRVTPFGRAVKRSSALFRLLARTRHYRRDAPSGQPLHSSLNPLISP